VSRTETASRTSFQGMKIRIGYGLGTQGMPWNGDDYGRFVDDLERLGFDSLWFSERINGGAPDPVTAMAFAAGRTTKLKFGMSVMVLPGRNPVLVAKEMASLAMLSDNRVLPAFGLGAADPREHAGFGVVREERAPMFNEALGLMRRLWTETNVSHEGRFYSCSGISVGPRLTKPLDVWLGGIAPSELRRVGRLADGWLPSFITASEAGEKKRLVEEAATEAGRVIEVDHFGVLIVYSSGEPLGSSFIERIKTRRPDVTDMSELFPVGIEELRTLINRFVDVGYSKFVLLPAGPPKNMTAELELLAAQVLTLEN
jgi:probable F420-dependent oxidoreductase